jgi:hypothetical protein
MTKPPVADRLSSSRRRWTGTHRLHRMIPASVIVALSVLVATACAAGPNTAAGHGAHDAGFWLGLWQGFIAPITFVVSLFNHSVGIYEVHNNGGWYNFAFLVGVSIFFSSTGGGARGRARSARRTR